MKVSNRQKNALEKITGRVWDHWHPEAVRAYFIFTDTGVSIPVSDEAKEHLDLLLEHHHWHSVDVEGWKRDFKQGLLFLWDFFGTQKDYEAWQEAGFPKDMPYRTYPDAYVKQAFEIYLEARGYIPIDEISGCKEWAERLGISSSPNK